MLVYRYEDRNHSGPFAHIGFNRRFAQLPTAQDIGLQWHIGQSASACISIDDLINYFGIANTQDLETKGYRIAEYDVPNEHVQYGSGQVVFNINQSVLRQFMDDDDY